MGHDWEGEFDFLKDHCEVIYLKRTEGISTTQIKKSSTVMNRTQICVLFYDIKCKYFVFVVI